MPACVGEGDGGQQPGAGELPTLTPAGGPPREEVSPAPRLGLRRRRGGKGGGREKAARTAWRTDTPSNGWWGGGQDVWGAGLVS